MDSPSPVPCGPLVVKNGSKTRSRIAEGMPTPVSLTVTTTSPSTTAVVSVSTPPPGIVHRVEDQVRQRLAELDGVARHLRERREIVLHLEHDAAAHGLLAPARLRDLERLAHHLVQVD